MEVFQHRGWLGHGSYGDVQLCEVSQQTASLITGRSQNDATESTHTSTFLALKTWKHAHHDTKIMRIALREVKVLQSLDHPNVVKLQCAFRTPSGRVCMAFDYGGKSTHQLIESRFPQGIPDPLLQRLAFQLVQAVRYLHAQKVLHRDIKPANILVDSSGLLRLCDFGLARHTSAGAAALRAAERLTPYVVTRWYRAPEVLVGMPYGAATDIWSVGVTLAELATGEPLLPGASSLDQLARITRAIGPLPPHLAVGLAKQLQDPSLRAPPHAAPPPAAATHAGARISAAIGQSQPSFGASYAGPQQQQERPSPSLLRQRLQSRQRSAALLQVLEACLRTDPRDRPTAEELLRMPYFLNAPRLFAGSFLEQVYAQEADRVSTPFSTSAAMTTRVTEVWQQRHPPFESCGRQHGVGPQPQLDTGRSHTAGSSYGAGWSASFGDGHGGAGGGSSADTCTATSGTHSASTSATCTISTNTTSTSNIASGSVFSGRSLYSSGGSIASRAPGCAWRPSGAATSTAPAPPLSALPRCPSPKFPSHLDRKTGNLAAWGQPGAGAEACLSPTMSAAAAAADSPATAATAGGASHLRAVTGTLPHLRALFHDASHSACDVAPDPDARPLSGRCEFISVTAAADLLQLQRNPQHQTQQQHQQQRQSADEGSAPAAAEVAAAQSDSTRKLRRLDAGDLETPAAGDDDATCDDDCDADAEARTAAAAIRAPAPAAESAARSRITNEPTFSSPSCCSFSYPAGFSRAAAIRAVAAAAAFARSSDGAVPQPPAQGRRGASSGFVPPPPYPPPPLCAPAIAGDVMPCSHPVVLDSFGCSTNVSAGVESSTGLVLFQPPGQEAAGVRGDDEDSFALSRCNSCFPAAPTSATSATTTATTPPFTSIPASSAPPAGGHSFPSSVIYAAARAARHQQQLQQQPPPQLQPPWRRSASVVAAGGHRGLVASATALSSSGGVWPAGVPGNPADSRAVWLDSYGPEASPMYGNNRLAGGDGAAAATGAVGSANTTMSLNWDNTASPSSPPIPPPPPNVQGGSPDGLHVEMQNLTGSLEESWTGRAPATAAAVAAAPAGGRGGNGSGGGSGGFPLAWEGRQTARSIPNQVRAATSSVAAFPRGGYGLPWSSLPYQAAFPGAAAVGRGMLNPVSEEPSWRKSLGDVDGEGRPVAPVGPGAAVRGGPGVAPSAVVQDPAASKQRSGAASNAVIAAGGESSGPRHAPWFDTAAVAVAVISTAGAGSAAERGDSGFVKPNVRAAVARCKGGEDRSVGMNISRSDDSSVGGCGAGAGCCVGDGRSVDDEATKTRGWFRRSRQWLRHLVFGAEAQGP